jgi:hypothetical protein
MLGVDTRLSLLLSSISFKYKPLCICSGVSHGDLDIIYNSSSFVPLILGLTPLVNSSLLFWEKLLAQKNLSNESVRIDSLEDKEMIRMLIILASCQVPRLLLVVVTFTVFYNFKSSKQAIKTDDVMERFRKEALLTYPEMKNALAKYSVADLSHIILTCSVRFGVREDSECVPGTIIKWSSLMEQSVIFPYSDFCYVMPLIWNTSVIDRVKQKRN